MVQERLGHSTLEMTLGTYGHVLPAMQHTRVSFVSFFFYFFMAVFTIRMSDKFKIIPVDSERNADYTVYERMFPFMKGGAQGYGSAELRHTFPMTTLGVNIVGLRGRLILILGRMIFEEVAEG